MNVEYRLVNGVQLAEFSGSLMGSDTTEIRQQLIQLITAQAPYLIINLSLLNFIDAKGLSAFVSAQKQARQYQGEVLLLNPTTKVRALIELLRLQYTFIIYLDETAAIEYCYQQNTKLIP